MATAPFTDEQVKNIREYQDCDYTHEYTCYNRHKLVVANNGLSCPECPVFKQTWVRNEAADGSAVAAHNHVMNQLNTSGNGR